LKVWRVPLSVAKEVERQQAGKQKRNGNKGPSSPQNV
jgi:hypothetical protein